MRSLCIGLLSLAAVASAAAQAPAPTAAAMAPATPTWGPVGPNLPAGAEMAVIQGDPSLAAPFTLRLKMPAGYVVKPHTHGTTLHATVLSGRVSVGHGDRVDLAHAPILGPGDFITVPANHPHFDAARSEAVIQIHGMGPLTLVYLNPADDPTPKPPSP